MKEKTKYVFVILVYKNTSDLLECIESIEDKVRSYKIIVVNAYYNDTTKSDVERIAYSHNCDFINIENRGYSYGNNRGIEIANNKYEYQYVVVSNPDIVIKDFDDEQINDKFEYDIIAPQIVAASGRRQNPMVIKKNKISEKLEYLGFKKRSSTLIYAGILLSKLCRWYHASIIRISSKAIYRIYEAHGSFVMISQRAISKLFPIYDENMFLFAEEGVLAARAQKEGFLTCYYDFIHIRHKEDGSMKLSNISVNEELRKANIYYYETYEKER